MVYIPTMKIISTWYRTNEFATLSGILLAVGNLGALSAAGPLAFFSLVLGWQQVFLILGAITLAIAGGAWAITRDRPQDMGLPSICEIEAQENGGSELAAGGQERIPMGAALKMTFGSGRKFWPMAVWFFFMYGSVMVYQGLWAGPFFYDVLGWEKTTYGLVITFIGTGVIFGCTTAGYISDKILGSRKKVLVAGSVAYTIIWAVIWFTAGSITSPQAYMAINFFFGFFGGFFVVSYAQIKELFPIAIVGTTTAALNIFPFAGGAVLQQVSGLILTSRSLEAYQSVWLLMLVCMIVATVAVSFSRESEEARARASRLRGGGSLWRWLFG
jgi:sugar phosphate permease